MGPLSHSEGGHLLHVTHIYCFNTILITVFDVSFMNSANKSRLGIEYDLQNSSVPQKECDSLDLNHSCYHSLFVNSKRLHIAIVLRK